MQRGVLLPLGNVLLPEILLGLLCLLRSRRHRSPADGGLQVAVQTVIHVLNRTRRVRPERNGTIPHLVADLFDGVDLLLQPERRAHLLLEDIRLRLRRGGLRPSNTSFGDPPGLLGRRQVRQVAFGNRSIGLERAGRGFGCPRLDAQVDERFLRLGRGFASLRHQVRGSAVSLVGLCLQIGDRGRLECR